MASADATMASADTLSEGQIVKEGYLATEKKYIHGAFKSEVNNYWVLAQVQVMSSRLACYKDHTKKKVLKEIWPSGIQKLEVDKQKYDNYISIKHGKQITHLRAESRQQRDAWYSAILGSLRYLGVASSADPDDDDIQMRPRKGTEPKSDRPAVGRNRPTGGTQSTPGVNFAFVQELRAATTRKLSVVQENESDEDLVKVRQDSFCCLRNHVVACNHEGSNMADEGIVYENVHFVRSEEEHLAMAQASKDSLVQTGTVYSSFHDLVKIQNTDQNIYETTIPRSPEEHDERDLVPGGNNLDIPEQQQHPVVGYTPNVIRDGGDLSPRDSLSSNEDNTSDETGFRLPRLSPGHVVGGTVGRPLLPLHTGERLRRKIQMLKDEQRQPNGIDKTFTKSCVVGERDKVILMEKKDSIWVIGLLSAGLRSALKVGDQLIKINKQVLLSAKFASDIIRSTDEDKVTMVLKRIPRAFICCIVRQSDRDDLGITLEGNEIISVDPYGLASIKGDLKPQTTGVSGRMCNWAITEINTLPVDLFASTDDIMKLLRKAGREVALIVQPVDFIQVMRDNLKLLKIGEVGFAVT